MQNMACSTLDDMLNYMFHIDTSQFDEQVLKIRKYKNQCVVIDFDGFGFDIHPIDTYNSSISLIFRNKYSQYTNIFQLRKVVENKDIPVYLKKYISMTTNFLISEKKLDKVIFTDFIMHHNYIKIKVIDHSFGNINEEYIYFDFNSNNHPSNIAIILALLSISINYNEIHIDLEINKNIYDKIKLLNKKISFKKIIHSQYELQLHKDKLALLFSGGIDSIAALYTLESNIDFLLSTSYGGIYEREEQSFKLFNPLILKTNFRTSDFFVKLESLGASFFSVQALLYCENLKFSQLMTGDILESQKNFNCTYTFNPFNNILNLKRIYPTLGLTEISTTKIVIDRNKNIIDSSLNSLAKIGTIKRLRKEILLNLHQYNTPIHDVIKLKHGQDFVTDFLILYILKHNKDLAHVIIPDIDDNFIEFAKVHKLNFYNKVNPKIFSSFQNNNNIETYIKNISLHDIYIYDTDDFHELHETAIFLSKFYKPCLGHIKFFN